MKQKVLYTIVTIIIMMLAFIGCSHNQAQVPVKENNILPTVSTTTYPVHFLPVWLLYIPEGENGIGIAHASAKKPSTELNVAKEYASASLARNHGIFNVDKSAVINYALHDSINSQKAEFGIVINSDASSYNFAQKNFQHYAVTEINDFKLYLFGNSNPNTNTELIRTSIANIPEWCKGRTIAEDAGFIYSIGIAEDLSLSDAWEKAHNDGLKKIAQRRLINTAASIRATDNKEKQIQIIDQAIYDLNTTITKTWLFEKITNGNRTYNVFLMLKSKKSQ